MRFLSTVLSAASMLVIGLLAYMAYTYLYTTGYGLHPAISAFLIACLFGCVYVFNTCPSLDQSECGEEECDITNDVFSNH